MKIVIASGGFDPLHIGHLNYLKAARQLGHSLVVGCNTDEWLTRKKGKPFMPLDQRIEIIRELNCVDMAWHFNDDDGTACNLIEEVIKYYGAENGHHFIFANGGDRTAENIPEQNRTYKAPVKFVFGVGGTNKMESSSRLLKEWS
jgi:cytidyltransferase-like protein